MRLGAVLVLAAILCAGALARADAQIGVVEAQVGTITSVGGDGIVMVDTGDKVITVTTDDNTIVTINGQVSKVSDLKKGMKAVVTPARGTAAKIVATTTK